MNLESISNTNLPEWLRNGLSIIWSALVWIASKPIIWGVAIALLLIAIVNKIRTYDGRDHH